MKQRFGILLALIGLFVIACALRYYCKSGRFSWCNYERIRAGMTLGEVQVLLGPGDEITLEEVPSTGGKQGLQRVVDGDRFFRWWDDPSRPNSTNRILVGFKDGKVHSKNYFTYGL